RLMQLSKREEEKNSHMASGFVSSIIKWTAEKLSSLIPAQMAGCSTSEPCTHVSEDFEMLQKTMLSIQKVLENTEEKDMQSFSEKLHIKELSGAAHDAEDVLEEYEYEVLRAKVIARRQVGSGRKRKFEEVCETSTDDIPILVPVPNNLIIRMKEIKKRFDTITKEWDTLRLRESDGLRRRDDHVWTPKPTSSLLHEPNVHGREKDKEYIIQMLLEDHENSKNSVSVLPIVGMGGIDFDVLELTRKIFPPITKRSCYYTELNEIVDALREELMGKRFLLVLDDVWNDKPNLWTPLRDFLFALEPGKVIVTTRNESTAKIMQTVPPHRLDRLGFEDCWLIFLQQAFEGRDPTALPELVEIGKKIVVKCKGLPLAVKVLGGLLRFESDDWKWTDILDSELWELDEEEDQILPALRLRYDRMPPALKQCFMHFSLFPNDYDFYKNNIVRLLMSQGLFRSDGTEREEDIGRAFLDDLLQRSILEYDPNYESKELLKMHDLVHDLAQSVAGEEFIRVDYGELRNLPGEVRHLSLVWSNSISNLNLLPLKKLNSLRKFLIIIRDDIFMHPEVHVDVLNDLFRNLKRLRALYLRWTRVGLLPESIGNLKLLRYLDVGDTDVKRLPESIFGLYNLQTLGITYDALEESHEAIKDLVNLRHFLLNEGTYPKYLLSGIRHLTKLQTLTPIHIGRESRHFKIQDLKNLSHLKGSLLILNLKNVTSVEDAEVANLKSKKDLKLLDLSWKCNDILHCNSSHGRNSGESSNVPSEATSSLLIADWFEEQVLASLEPHTNLEEFIVSYYSGIRFP
ncbi:putative disease resistance RPP13-like protein 1, partial [Ananas comosus]